MKKLFCFVIAGFLSLSALQAQTFKSAQPWVFLLLMHRIFPILFWVWTPTIILRILMILSILGVLLVLEIILLTLGDLDDAMFLPIAAAARLKVFGLFGAGADIGYAIGLTDYLDGGFYFRPVVTFDIADTIELNASYESQFQIRQLGVI